MTDDPSTVLGIHLLKCSGEEDTVSNLLLRWEMMRNILNNFDGPWYVFWLSLSGKYRNLDSSSSLSLVMSPKPSVAITLLVLKYDHREGF
jgi:hypothetical protein